MNELLAQIIRSASFTISGNVGSQPEVRFFESGASVCNFSLAVNRPGAKKGDGQEPDWFRIEAWNDQAQSMADGLSKGQRVTVTGRIRSDKYTARNGEERTSLILRVDEWRAADAPRPATSAPAPVAAAAPATPAAGATTWQSNGGFDDSEVPF